MVEQSSTETIESLDIDEGDYFPFGKIDVPYYGDSSGEDQWKIVFRTAPMRENKSTHIVRDPDGRYVIFSTNIDGYHYTRQIGDRITADPVTPEGDEVDPLISDVFHEIAAGGDEGVWDSECTGSTFHFELSHYNGWDSETLETLRAASRMDISFDVELVDEE